MTQGAISLIIAAYNRAAFVGKTIESVLNQSRGDFELVVWDDGSTDDTFDVARDAARGDPRVRVMQGANQGAADAINSAARHVSAPYFGWIDSDDFLANTALEETSASLDARPEIGVVYTNYLVIDPAGNVQGEGSRCKVPYSKDRLLVDFMTFHFRLMRRPLFDQVGQLDPSLPYAEDYDLCLRLSEITPFHHLARPLYFYRVHPQSVSKQHRLKQIENASEAIRRALVRRKMDQKYELEVEYRASFHLKRRGAG
jgi:glycosyltransferase involved in cell wall biosynthesis